MPTYTFNMPVIEYSPASFHDQHLWYSPRIPIHVVKKWDNKGLRIVKEVLDVNNLIKS